jgi:hypothetical protein
MGVLLTTGEREIAVGWSDLSVEIGVGDKSLVVSVKPGILPII